MNIITQNNECECPICMDIIDELNNRVTTECGHVFHCSCLMKNTVYNGFGCPYCRTSLAEITEQNHGNNTNNYDSDDNSDDSDDSDNSDDDTDDYLEEENKFLTSFRMFHQQINGLEVEEDNEEEDNEEEDNEEEDNEEEDNEEEDTLNHPVPDFALVSIKLLERGITFDDLVKTILYHEHDNYLRQYSKHERRSSEVYGQFRAVISRFKHEQNTIRINNTNNRLAEVTRDNNN